MDQAFKRKTKRFFFLIYSLYNIIIIKRKRRTAADNEEIFRHPFHGTKCIADENEIFF